MEENPNPTWLARLIFVLMLFVTIGFFAFLAYGLIAGRIRKKDFQDIFFYIYFFGFPAAAACLSAAAYFIVIGNPKPQDSTIIQNTKEAYSTYLLFTGILMALGYLFSSPA